MASPSSPSRPSSATRAPAIEATGSQEIASFDAVGRRISVACRIAFDGVENVGRLWFAPEDGSEPAIPDRAAIGGRTREEVLELARRLSPYELSVRYRRATAEKRRFLALRRNTDEIIAKVRYMNQIAISMKIGLIDREGGSQEIELVERQIMDYVTTLKDNAGVEG